MNKTILWNRIKMPIASIIWLTTMISIVMTTYNFIEPWMYSAFALIAVIFFVGTDRLSFFIYILLTVSSVFVALVFAFIHEWTTAEQVWGIAIHFVFLIHLFALYSLAKYVFQFSTENKFLRELVFQLEGYISESGILSHVEFEKRATGILAGMLRRNEVGYYVYVDLSTIPRSIKQTVMMSVGTILQTTIRNHYDLVGRHDNNSLVLLLQNIGPEEFEIVKGRIKGNLEERFEEETLKKIKWSIKETEGHATLPKQVIHS
ncbi:hypothetical protein ACXYMX_05560 [Sporosarcina sp. CAU 1771]